MPQLSTSRRTTIPARQRSGRPGMVLIWCALMLTALLGMVGLVLDAGMCMASQRQAQNAADAGALAAAMDKLLGKTNAQATATAATFVKTYNQDHPPEVTLDPIVNMPPTSGPYKNISGYVEVIVKINVKTFFIQLLGSSSTRQVSARSVAGTENLNGDYGAVLLDPTARPGLSVSGLGRLSVNGTLVVNSNGGGVTETGANINNGQSGNATTVDFLGHVYAKTVNTVGGTNNPGGFSNYPSGSPNPLHTKQQPLTDPLATVPTPTISNGVDPQLRGNPISSTFFQLANDPSGLNKIVTQPNGSKYLQLYPGAYNSITITGGSIRFYPGIYVLQPTSAGATTLAITGIADVTANGVMFYNTGSNYNPNTGTPDINDANSAPPITDGALLGPIQMTALSTARMSPIDTTNGAYVYGGYRPGAPIPTQDFNGLLIYQRRNSTQPFSLKFDATLTEGFGTFYAKWAQMSFSGISDFIGQFVVGSMKISLLAEVTVTIAGTTARSKQVYLVE
jgi:Flp pilus assembly protein TadG